MAVIKKDGGYMALPINVKRGNPIPLDASSIWYSLTDMQAYAKTDATAYVGQILTLVDEANATAKGYIILNAAGNLQEIGTGAASNIAADGKSITFDSETLRLRDFGKKYYRFVPATETTEATYILQEVDDTHPWKAGLTPQVASQDGELVLAWYEPNPTTVEGLQTQVGSLQTSVDDLTATVASLGSSFKFKGSVTSFEDLPTLTAKNGDVYQVGDKEYAFDGTTWVELGSNVDLSGLATKSEVGDLSALIGKPAEGENLATGIFARLDEIENAPVGDLNTIEGIAINGTLLSPTEEKIVNIPVFGGDTSGLVPVLSAGITDSSKVFLNGSGEWATPLDTRIGDLTLEGTTYNTVEEYVDAKINGTTFTLDWEAI